MASGNLDEQLVTTEQCDFEVNADTQRNWRDLIRDNPFEANQSAFEQAPRESLMMMVQAENTTHAPTMDSEGFGMFGDEVNSDTDLSRSDRFNQRVVSLGPHSYIN